MADVKTLVALPLPSAISHLGRLFQRPGLDGPPGPFSVSKVPVNDEAGLTLTTTTLRATQDVVSLCRRARSAAGEFGLDAIGTRRLCAAVLEIGEAVTA